MVAARPRSARTSAGTRGSPPSRIRRRARGWVRRTSACSWTSSRARVSPVRPDAGVSEEKGVARHQITPTALTDHYIVVGYGRVGSVIGEALRATASPMLVIEERAAAVAGLSALRTASASARMGDEAPLPHQVQAFTFDYAGRAVLSIVRTEPSSR